VDSSLFASGDTRTSRIRIGFPTPDAWRDAPAYYDGHTLTIEGHPVMEDWETGYMRDLAEIATRSGGTILEIGFGMGISAGYIQARDIREHIIIEANRQVHDHATAFARSARVRTRALLGMWETITPLLPDGSVTGILFDTYPLLETEIHQNHFAFFPEAYRLLVPGGIFTYYSDEVEDFSPRHRAALLHAGFQDIDKQVSAVTPPADCLYWRSPTIVAPIITR
jgi:guanidinoacetate N-methyltransferase